jgi:hypothetical protein
MTEEIPAFERSEQAAPVAGTVTAACVGVGNADNGGGPEEVDEYDELLAALSEWLSMSWAMFSLIAWSEAPAFLKLRSIRVTGTTAFAVARGAQHSYLAGPSVWTRETFARCCSR